VLHATKRERKVENHYPSEVKLSFKPSEKQSYKSFLTKQKKQKKTKKNDIFLIPIN